MNLNTLLHQYAPADQKALIRVTGAYKASMAAALGFDVYLCGTKKNGKAW